MITSTPMLQQEIIKRLTIFVGDKFLSRIIESKAAFFYGDGEGGGGSR